jgi:S-(hydroxymethyl)glutathione dehydrogenase/alcohol dehydrogenase
MPDRTFAAVLRETGAPLTVEEIELYPPGPDQVRVKLAATGVCHSDLSLAGGTLKQPTPAVLGHEGAGRVVRVGANVTTLDVGDPVVLNWAPACGGCWFCAHGEPYLCENAEAPRGRPYARLIDGTELYPGLGVGAFATETVVAAGACVKLPEDIPLSEAALLGCAVLTGVGAIRNAAGVRPGESVVVIGLGGVGLSAVQGARIAGADPIIAVDPLPAKADLALRLGASDVFEPGPELAKRVRALCGGRGADHAIECVGRATTIRAAWSATRRGGRATVLGLGSTADEVTFNALEVAYFARTLAGCMYGSTDPAVDLPLLVEYWRTGELDLNALVSNEIGLSDVDDAFNRMRAGSDVRSLIRLDK